MTGEEKKGCWSICLLLCVMALCVHTCIQNSKKTEPQKRRPIASSSVDTPSFSVAKKSTASYQSVANCQEDPCDAGYTDGYEVGYEAGIYGDNSELWYSYEGENRFEPDQMVKYRQGYDAGYQDGYNDGYTMYKTKQ